MTKKKYNLNTGDITYTVYPSKLQDNYGKDEGYIVLSPPQDEEFTVEVDEPHVNCGIALDKSLYMQVKEYLNKKKLMGLTYREMMKKLQCIFGGNIGG